MPAEIQYLSLTMTLQQLTKIVEAKKARLLMVGDYRQMDAVQAHGKIFEQLSELGDKAEFTRIMR